MKNNIIFYIFLLTILLSNCVSAETIYSDYVLPQLSSIIEIYSRDLYYSGDDINAIIEIFYNSPYYLPDALLVVQLIRANEEGEIYPSDLIDQNVFYEKIYNLNLKPGDVINISFNYRLPLDIEEGKYYIVTYLYTPLSYILGLPFIFLPGNYKEFYVISERQEGFPYVRIYRKESKINFESPTVGALVKDFVNLRISLLSDIDTKAKIIIKYAPWDDISRKTSILSEEIVNLSKGLNYFNFNYNLGFLDPNVYSIRVEVYVNETLQSLYRFRFIKSGPTALLRGILLDRDRNLLIIVGPSPDHYLYPITEDVSLIVESKNLGYNREIYLGRLEYISTGFIYVNLSLDDKIKDSFDICAYLYSGNILTDSYCIKYSEVKPKPFLDISFSEGILKVNSTVNGLLIIDSLDENKTYSYQISIGYNEIPLNYGKYFIVFTSDEIYLEKEITSYPKEEKAIKLLNKETLSILFIVLLLLVLILTIIVMIKMLLKGKKEFLRVIIFLLGFILLSKISYSLRVTLEESSFCSINGSIEVNIVNKIENYDVFVKIYDNERVVYSSNYSCEEERCNLYIRTPTLYPKNYILNLLIKIGEEYEERNFTITSLYPYNIRLLYNTIYAGAKAAVLIENVSKCQNLENYTKRLFNFTYNLTSETYSLIRKDCPYSGDPEWGERICELDFSNFQRGFYRIYANYTIDGFSISQFVGILEIKPATYYIFSRSACYHAWSAQGLAAQYSYGISGRYRIDGDIIVLANNSKFSITNINYINYLCSNGVLGQGIARIFGFVYENIDFESLGSYERGKLIYGRDNSIDSFGGEVGNIMLEIYRKSRDRGFNVRSYISTSNSFDLYTFRSPGYYTIFINQVNAICNSPMIFVCPSTIEDKNVCRIGVHQDPVRYVGWRTLNQYKILVPSPNVSGTYTETIEVYPYFNKTDRKWYLYVTNYQQANYKERLSYKISNQIPSDALIIGRFKNTGYGKLNISINISDFRVSSTIRDGETRMLYLNITRYIVENCYKKDCTIKFDIKYVDAYNLTNEFYLADPYVNIKWNNISVVLIEPGYLRGNFISILLNITNLGPIVAQNIGLLSYNASRCVILYGEDPIDVLPHESKIYKVFVAIKDPNCSPSEYIANLKIGGINTLDKEITVDIFDYLIKIAQYREKIIIEERIYIVGLLLVILLILAIL